MELTNQGSSRDGGPSKVLYLKGEVGTRPRFSRYAPGSTYGFPLQMIYLFTVHLGYAKHHVVA